VKLLVGLGNPGTKYARNRHNVGFRVLDTLWDKHQGTPWRSRFHSECSELRLGSDKCLLLKPQTYMNDSGRAVGAAMQFFKLALEDVIVFYDEIDLNPGKLRIKTGGGVAGHNGLRSISAHVGNDFVRVRIGVGRPQQKHEVANYVLRDFAKADETWLEPLIDSLVASGDKIVTGDYAGVMNEAALVVQAAIGGDENKGTSSKKGTPSKQAATDKKTSAKPNEQSAKPGDKSPDNSDGTLGGALADKLKNWLKDKKE